MSIEDSEYAKKKKCPHNMISYSYLLAKEIHLDTFRAYFKLQKRLSSSTFHIIITLPSAHSQS